MKRFSKILLTTLAIHVFFSGSALTYGHSKCSSDTVKAVVVDTFRLMIIPPSTGVQFYKGGILFLSQTKNEKKMAPNHISFGNADTYFSNINDSITGKHNLFSSSDPFSYPCEAVTFSSNYKKIYFTGLPKKGMKEKIFVANMTHDPKTDGEFISDVAQLDLCKDDSRCSHPTLAKNDSIMIFASDMKGSEGGMDLYISRWEEGQWSDPVNLGKEINTKGNELSPFLDSENNLYYSSDKLPGHGGYDIFTCRNASEGWEKPVNLTGINSSVDDIAFTMNKNDGKTAFYTRRTSAGTMQLFKVSLYPGGSEQSLTAVFNNPPVLKNAIATLRTDSIKPVSEMKIAEAPAPQAKTEAVVIPVTIAVTENDNQPALANAVIIKPTLQLSSEMKDVVIYRVQIFTTTKPKTEKEIVFNGKHYRLYEYFYLNAYRYTIGEFRTLQQATELQKLCRQSEYPQAFVAAFLNNTRSVTLK